MDSIVKCIETLIQNNADINCSFLDGPNAGETPLISAARLNQLNLSKLLIEKKADVSAVSKNGRTAFYYAVDKKNVDLLESLIEASQNPEEDLKRRYDNNMSLTHVVLQKINNFTTSEILKIMQILFDHGVDPDSTDSHGDTPLHIAAKSDEAKDIVTLLIHKGCNPQQTNNSERTVFSVADKKMIPIIIRVSNEEESIEAMEEREQYKREREERETVDRIKTRNLQLATYTPSESGEKKVDSKKKAQLLAMTKRGGTLRTPRHTKGTKYTPVKKMEARPWGGSKQAAKFQRDTRLTIRKIKEDVLEHIQKLREEVKEIRKKIDIEAGNISESEENNEEDIIDDDDENDQDSFHNDLPEPGTELNNNNQSNSDINVEEKNDELIQQPSHVEEEDKLDLNNQQHLNDDDDENLDLNTQEQQHPNDEDNLDNFQQPHNDDEENLDFITQEQQHSNNEDNFDLNLNDEQLPNGDDDIDNKLNDDDAPVNNEHNSINDEQIDNILNGGSDPIDLGE